MKYPIEHSDKSRQKYLLKSPLKITRSQFNYQQKIQFCILKRLGILNVFSVEKEETIFSKNQ